MRYFVVAPDGSQFGPADMATLRIWASEGRIAPDTILVEEATRRTVAARLVPGVVPIEGSVPPPQPLRRPEEGRRSDNSDWDVIWSYICSALTIICCLPFILGAFVYANRAIGKGNRAGYRARIVAWIFLMLWIVLTILTIPLIGGLVEMFKNQTGIGLR